MIKVIITAPKGAMDSMIVEEAWKNPKLEIIGCIGNPKKDYIGKDIGDVVPGIGQKTGVFVYGSIDEIIDSCDVVLDFSTVELSMEVLPPAKHTVKHCSVALQDSQQNKRKKSLPHRILFRLSKQPTLLTSLMS